MVFSIHRVAIENTDLANQPVDRYVPIDIPFRIFNVLSAYEGTENITKIW